MTEGARASEGREGWREPELREGASEEGSRAKRDGGTRAERARGREGTEVSNKIATQGAPQMAVDKEANSLSRVYSYYSKFNLRLFYV